MIQFNLGQLDEHVRRLLQTRAKEHGRSIDDEVRHILTDALQRTRVNGRPGDLGSEIAAQFRACPLDEPIPELRGHEAHPADLDA